MCESIIIKSIVPRSLSKIEASICLRLISSGGAVNVASVEGRLGASTKLVVAFAGTRLIGVGAIKNVHPQHARSVAQSSGIDFPDGTRELGNVAVDVNCEARGVGSGIVACLVNSWTGPLYATTFNPKMLHILPKFGFVVSGRCWESEIQPGAKVQLLLRGVGT